MNAPTEAEIRESVQRALDASSIDIGEWVHDLLRPLQYAPVDERGANYGGGLWDDLRPSQAACLDGLTDEVYAKAQPLEAEVTDRIREFVVEAALAFARAHPAAPRAKPELVTA